MLQIIMIKAGDYIRHVPSQLKSIVVYYDGVEIIPEGKLTWLKVEDCQLISSCTQLEHEECLQKWARCGTDIRKSRCAAALTTAVNEG